MLTEKRDLRGGYSLWSDSPRGAVIARTVLLAEKCDVAIVGGGVSAALAAISLARAGFDVVVIDRRAPGQGSTVASTAMIQFEIDTPLTKLSEKIGPRNAARAWRRSFTAISALKKIIDDNDIAAAWRNRDALYLAGSEMGYRGLQAETAQRQRIGLPSTYLSAAELSAKFGIERTGAILSSGSADLNPIQLSAGCLRAARKLGGRVYSEQEIVSVDAAARSVRLTTAQGGVIDARRAVFATGYEVVNGLPKDKFEITSSWAIATQPLPPEAFWPSRCLIWEAADPYLYMRTTSDNRIVAGGEDSALKDPARRDAAIPSKSAKILAAVNALLPGRNLRVDYAWAGAFAESPTGLPLFEPVEGLPNCLAILGCGGNGITFSTVASEVITAWASGKKDPDWDLFRTD